MRSYTINRRSFLGASALSLAALHLPISSAQPSHRCMPRISGALRQYNHDQSSALGKEGWQRELQEEATIGFDLLWLANLDHALVRDSPEDPLLVLLDTCAERQVQVIMGIGSTAKWFGDLNVEEECAAASKSIDLIRARYAAHPAFHAWYIPHEIYVAYDDFGNYIGELYPRLVERCRQAVPKPVTISPFYILDQDKVFGNFRYAAPEEYGAYWEGLIRRSGLDVIMLQDSGEHFSYVTNDQRRPFFAAMQQACAGAGAKLWGNVETAEFDCPSKDEYVRRYGRIHHGTVKDAPWRAVPLPRLKEKLDLAAEYSERIVCWGYYEKCKPSLGPEGSAWYEAYRQYVQPKLQRP